MHLVARFMFVLVILMSAYIPPLIQSQLGEVTILRSSAAQFPIIAANLRIRDRHGQDVTELGKQDIQVIEEGVPITNTTVLLQSTTSITPSLHVTLVAAAPDLPLEITLTSPSAAIGIVFDSTELLNTQQHKYTEDGRTAIERFLLSPTPDNLSAPRTKSPENPEVFSLYIPVAKSDQEVQPGQFAGFTADRNSVINYLRGMQPRLGTTNLYDAVLKAVQDTAAVARKRGSAAVVLIVSDGSDTGALSDDTLREVRRQANDNQVKIVAFGFGKALNTPGHGDRLLQLASSTAGVYKPYPAEPDIIDAFKAVVSATPASIYILQYHSQSFDDGKPHTFVVRVKLADGFVESDKVSFSIAGGANGLPPLEQILLRRYVLIAIPLALLISFMLMLIAGGIRWFQSGPLKDRITKH